MSDRFTSEEEIDEQFLEDEEEELDSAWEAEAEVNDEGEELNLESDLERNPSHLEEEPIDEPIIDEEPIQEDENAEISEMELTIPEEHVKFLEEDLPDEEEISPPVTPDYDDYDDDGEHRDSQDLEGYESGVLVGSYGTGLLDLNVLFDRGSSAGSGRQNEECDESDPNCWPEIPGEDVSRTPSALSLEMEEIPPPRIPSEEQFFIDYMAFIPETPGKERLSKEAIDWEDRRKTPSPPGTPRKTLRRMHECPSVESFLKLGDPVHVHFHVLPGQKLFSVEARLDRTVADLKHDISPICKVPPEFIDIRRNRNLVMDYKTLKDLGAKPRRKMKFTIEVSKRCPLDYTLKIPVENRIEQLPSVQRRVKVQTDKGIKYVKLTIEFAGERKVFIGGYRDKRMNVVYHHGATQTPFYSEPYSDKVQHFSCQTFDNTWKTVQTKTESYQQTYRPDYHISSIEDRVVWARPYLSSAYIEFKRTRAAIIIQKYWRRWLAIRERAERLDGLIRRVEWAENIRKGRTESRLAIKEDEMWRQHHPSRMVDVELLYRAINEWRREQVEYVDIHRWGPDRKAALAVIMEKEADLLLDLERTKTTIKNATYDNLIESIFRKMGDPTRWLNRTGNFVALDNKDKHDMRQYHKLYNTLKSPVTDTAERCILLDKLSSYVKSYNSDLSQYLLTLIGREKSLMERKAGEHLLIGLRQRIMNIFYHLLRDPHFNPEARKLQKVPFDSTKLRKDMIQCKGCRKMQYRDQFTVVRGVTVTTRCVTCMALYRTCILRSDLNLYRRMLAELRHDEQSAGVESSVTYLIDAYDMQFLIEQLWHGQSALSGIDDRYLLRICRWKRNLPWTPWNCVLLTEEESVAHLHLEDMSSAYQKSFFHKVQVKHQGARIYFARLTSLSIPLDPALETYCDNLAKQKSLLKRRKKSSTKN